MSQISQVFARLIKYVLVFINGMIFLGQFEQTKPIMSYLAASSGVVALVLGVAAKDAFEIYVVV